MVVELHGRDKSCQEWQRRTDNYLFFSSCVCCSCCFEMFVTVRTEQKGWERNAMSRWCWMDLTTTTGVWCAGLLAYDIHTVHTTMQILYTHWYTKLYSVQEYSYDAATGEASFIQHWNTPVASRATVGVVHTLRLRTKVVLCASIQSKTHRYDSRISNLWFSWHLSWFVIIGLWVVSEEKMVQQFRERRRLQYWYYCTLYNGMNNTEVDTCSVQSQVVCIRAGLTLSENDYKYSLSLLVESRLWIHDMIIIVYSRRNDGCTDHCQGSKSQMTWFFMSSVRRAKNAYCKPRHLKWKVAPQILDDSSPVDR